MLCDFKQTENEIENKPIKIEISNNETEKLGANKSIKTFKAYINPSLDWSDEFEYAKKKLETSTKKIINTEMEVCQVHVYFNVHILTNAYCRCEIVNFSPEQTKNKENM